MDTKIREFLTRNRMHHPKADVDCLYLARRKVGRGMIQLQVNCKTRTIRQMNYLGTREDWMLKPMKDHEDKRNFHSL